MGALLRAVMTTTHHLVALFQANVVFVLHVECVTMQWTHVSALQAEIARELTSTTWSCVESVQVIKEDVVFGMEPARQLQLVLSAKAEFNCLVDYSSPFGAVSLHKIQIAEAKQAMFGSGQRHTNSVLDAEKADFVLLV